MMIVVVIIVVAVCTVGVGYSFWYDGGHDQAMFGGVFDGFNYGLGEGWVEFYNLINQKVPFFFLTNLEGRDSNSQSPLWMRGVTTN